VSTDAEECCTLGPGLRAEQTALYAVYRAWCHNAGAPATSSRTFPGRPRELVGLASPKQMTLPDQRTHFPGIATGACGVPALLRLRPSRPADPVKDAPVGEASGVLALTGHIGT
jgi:hypothetical protein